MPETALWAALFFLAGIGQEGRSVDPEPASLFEFDRAVAGEWIIVNDGVMGGLSSSRFTDSDSSFATFTGELSLENNGGFSLARLSVPTMEAAGFSKIVLEVKGDSKRYQFRLKEKKGQMHSYVHFFETHGDWQTIEIPFEKLIPAFRGRTMNLPDFAGDQIEEIGLLVGNKKEEDFQIRIRTISLQ